jgi:hypothetical protein
MRSLWVAMKLFGVDIYAFKMFKINCRNPVSPFRLAIHLSGISRSVKVEMRSFRVARNPSSVAF